MARRDTYHLGWYPGAGNRSANGGGLNAVGTNGYHWAATTVSAGSRPQYASYLYVYEGDVYPANNYHRATGFSVRCVAALLGGWEGGLLFAESFELEVSFPKFDAAFTPATAKIG